MKIGQVIDEIVKDRKKEFESLGLTLYWDYTTCQIQLKTKKGTKRDCGILVNDVLDRDWELVRKSVSFMEAVASGKNIKVEHNIISPDFLIYYLNLGLLLKRLNDNFKVSQVRTILLEGKFYIEEEN